MKNEIKKNIKNEIWKVVWKFSLYEINISQNVWLNCVSHDKSP